MIEEIYKNINAKTAQQSEIFDKIINDVDASALFTTIFSYYSFGIAESFSDSTHGTIPAKIELLASKLMPRFGLNGKREITPWDIAICDEYIDSLLSLRSFTTLTSIYHDDIEINKVISSTKAYSSMVRGSAFPEQTSEEIYEIQGKFDMWFIKEIGISPTKAVEILLAIINIEEENYNNIKHEFINSANIYGDNWTKINKIKCKSQEEIEFSKKFDKKKDAMSYGYLEGLINFSNHIPANYEQVSNMCSITLDELNSLLRLLAVNKDNIINYHVEMLRERPIYIIPENKIVIADISNCLDCLWNSFDSIAKLNQQYQKHKSDWLELKIIDYLSRLFPSANIFHKLDYENIEKNDGSTAELDIAVVWEPFIILIEAKAKQFRLESQQGDVGRLRTDIKANIEDAFYQAKRALNYIKSNDEVEFIERKSKKSIKIINSKYYKKYLIAVSLHLLADLSINLSNVASLGLFQENEYPISLCISDFDIITQFCITPDILLHYFDRRLFLEKQPEEIKSDELDLFGSYLQNRLNIKNISSKHENFDMIVFSTFSEIFDKYFRYKRGEIREKPLIKINIPDGVLNIIIELNKRTDHSSRWIAFALLDLNNTILISIDKAISDLFIANLKPNVFRRVVFHDDDTVISIVASISHSLNDLQKRCQYRCEVEKYRTKSKKSIGICINPNIKHRPFESAYYIEYDWAFEEDMERLIANEPPFKPINNSNIPGRNEPCICGSGKKFKKCCLLKIKEANDIL